MNTLFDLPEPQPKKKEENPMLAVYGNGPADKHCRDCKHMRYVQFSKKYWKCDLRRLSHSPSTDHRRTWPTCGKFEQAEQ